MMVERSTSVISLGKQVIEKIQVETASLEDGQLVYRFTDSPMCDYMVKFIGKLRAIPSAELVNKVKPTSFYQRIRISFPCKKKRNPNHHQQVYFMCKARARQYVGALE